MFNLVPPSLRHSAAAFEFLEETEMDANILSLHNSKAKEATTPRKDSARQLRKGNSSRLSKPSTATVTNRDILAPSFHNPFATVDKETTNKGTNDFQLKIEKLLKEQYFCLYFFIVFLEAHKPIIVNLNAYQDLVRLQLS